MTAFLPDLVETQDTLFTFLEGRQVPALTGRLLLLAGVTSALLAKASHDLGDAHAALTQSRTAFLGADSADHNGLRGWIRGLQSLITPLGNEAETLNAIRRAEMACERVEPDDVDELGGLCTFSTARQSYYTSDALTWLPAQAVAAEDHASAAVHAYGDTSAPHWDYSSGGWRRHHRGLHSRTGEGSPSLTATATAPPA